MDFDLWVGRNVWYRQMHSNPSVPGTAGGDLAAVVSHIHADGSVNLMLIDAVGNTHARQHVPFKPPGAEPPGGDYAMFPTPLEQMFVRQREQADALLAHLKQAASLPRGLLFGVTADGTFQALDPATNVERPATDEEIEKYGLVEMKRRVDSGEVAKIDAGAAVQALRSGNAEALAAAGVIGENTVHETDPQQPELPLEETHTPPPLSPPAEEASNDASNAPPPDAA